MNETIGYASTTTTSNNTGGVFYYCPCAGGCSGYNSNKPTPEEPVPDNIDNVLMDKLTAMRDTRDAAARYAQSKNDEASLHEIEAIRLRAQAGMMYREINEGVPMSPDGK